MAPFLKLYVALTLDILKLNVIKLRRGPYCKREILAEFSFASIYVYIACRWSWEVLQKRNHKVIFVASNGADKSMVSFSCSYVASDHMKSFSTFYGDIPKPKFFSSDNMILPEDDDSQFWCYSLISTYECFTKYWYYQEKLFLYQFRFGNWKIKTKERKNISYPSPAKQ